jgi:hypothetical protein
MFNNLTGWHFLIILGVNAAMALVILGVVIVAVRSFRRKSRDHQ